jgi:chromosome segregation ATPase
MEEKENKTSNRNPIVSWFCGIIIFTLVLLIAYLCHSTKILAESQERIVTEHVRHIAKVDSLFFDMKEVILSSDSGKITNAPVLLSQLQKDSALFKREILLSQEEMSNLVKLHIDKIENDYAQIGIWGGVLSVIFIIFGFFAIFKIEESKKDANEVIEEIKSQSNTTTKHIEELQSQASELNTFLNGIKDDGNSFIQRKTEEFEKLKINLNNTLEQSADNSEKIQGYLNEFENKNGQYQLTLEMIEKQTKQFEELFLSLQETLERIRKEANNG